MVSNVLTYKVRGGKSRGEEGKAHNSKAILIPSARKNTLPPHTSCYLPGGLRAIQMCAILPYRANSLSMSRSVASGSRFPTYTLASGMLACLLLLRDDDDGSGRGGRTREGCVDEGGKQDVRGRPQGKRRRGRRARRRRRRRRCRSGAGWCCVVVQVQQRRRTTTLHGAWKEAAKSSCSFSKHY